MITKNCKKIIHDCINTVDKEFMFLYVYQFMDLQHMDIVDMWLLHWIRSGIRENFFNLSTVVLLLASDNYSAPCYNVQVWPFSLVEWVLQYINCTKRLKTESERLYFYDFCSSQIHSIGAFSDIQCLHIRITNRLWNIISPIYSSFQVKVWCERIYHLIQKLLLTVT